MFVGRDEHRHAVRYLLVGLADLRAAAHLNEDVHAGGARVGQAGFHLHQGTSHHGVREADLAKAGAATQGLLAHWWATTAAASSIHFMTVPAATRPPGLSAEASATKRKMVEVVVMGRCGATLARKSSSCVPLFMRAATGWPPLPA